MHFCHVEAMALAGTLASIPTLMLWARARWYAFGPQPQPQPLLECEDRSLVPERLEGM